MLVLPAIDIKEGKVVRLTQGEAGQQTVYDADPVSMAQRLEAEGAQCIHVVDLSGAFAGDRPHAKLIKTMIKSVSIPVEIGGGIRDEKAIYDYVEAGAVRAIIGSRAVEDRDFVSQMVEGYGSHIAISVDAKDGYVATKGWVDVSEEKAIPFMEDMKARGVETVIYTDISRDGMLQGPNLKAMAEAHAIGGLNVIASGGVSKLADLQALAELGLYGAITGKALYEKKLTMAEIRDFQKEQNHVG